MAMRESDYPGGVPVDGYGPGFFRVEGQVHRGALIVASDGARTWSGLEDAAPLVALGGRIDVLFLGMGADIAHPPAALVALLEDAGLMVEPMSTPSAARSYNITLSEGRRVACALLPV